MTNYWEPYEDDLDYEDGFENYVPTTVKPGPWLFTGTMIFIVSLILSLGPLVWLGRRWRRYRKERKRAANAALAKVHKRRTLKPIEHSYINADWQRENVKIEVQHETNPDAPPYELPRQGHSLSEGRREVHPWQVRTEREKSEGTDTMEAPASQVSQGASRSRRSLKNLFKKEKQVSVDNGPLASDLVEPGYSLNVDGNNEGSKPESLVLEVFVEKCESFTSTDRPNTTDSTAAQPSPKSRKGGTIMKKVTGGLKGLVSRDREQRAATDSAILSTVDQILDPSVYEDGLQVIEKITHENEEGVPDGFLIDIYGTSALDQRPFGTKRQNACSGVKLARKRSFLQPQREDGDFEEEDAFPEGAFHQYYRDCEDDESVDSTHLQSLKPEGTASMSGDFAQDITRGWTTYGTVLSCDKEARKLRSIAIPATWSTLTDTLLSAITTALISRNLGPEAFTTYAIVSLFFGLTDSLISGVYEAETVLTASAIGMENYFLSGQYAQLTVVLYVLFAVPLYSIWVLFVDNIVIAWGFSEDISSMTRHYIPIAALNYLVNGVAEGLDNLLWCAGYSKSMTLMHTVFSVFLLLAIAAVTNVSGATINSIAWVQIVYGVLYGTFVLGFTKYFGYLDPFWKGLVKNLALKNGKLIKGVLKMAIPLSFGTLMAECEWEILTFFAAYMGEAEVATWAIAGAIWSVFETAPAGISEAAEIRIGYHLGNGNPGMAKIAAYKCLVYSVVWSAAVTTLFACCSDWIISMFTDDATLASMLEELVPLMAVGNVLVCLGSDSCCIITAQTRPKLCTKIYFVCTWFVVVPLSAYFVYARNYGLQAMVASVVVAYGLVAVSFLYVVFTSNWAKISKKVIAEAEEED